MLVNLIIGSIFLNLIASAWILAMYWDKKYQYKKANIIPEKSIMTLTHEPIEVKKLYTSSDGSISYLLSTNYLDEGNLVYPYDSDGRNIGEVYYRVMTHAKFHTVDNGYVYQFHTKLPIHTKELRIAVLPKL